jgi:hypothetical protein
MATALFIDAEYLKATTLVDDNVEDKLIAPTIEMAMDLYIHPLLGTDLYEDIQAQIVANTVSADYAALLKNYIAPCLKFYVMFELTTWLDVKYRNKGVQTQNSDNSQSPDFFKLNQTASKWKNHAEVMGQRMGRYLCGNTVKYPKYLSNNELWDISPAATSLNPTLWLGDGTFELRNIEKYEAPYKESKP